MKKQMQIIINCVLVRVHPFHRGTSDFQERLVDTRERPLTLERQIQPRVDLCEFHWLAARFVVHAREHSSEAAVHQGDEHNMYRLLRGDE